MLSNYHIFWGQFFATRFPKNSLLQISAVPEFVRYDTALWDLKFEVQHVKTASSLDSIDNKQLCCWKLHRNVCHFTERHLERCGQRELESLSLPAGDTRNIQLVCPVCAGVVLRTWRSLGNVVSALDCYWLSTKYLEILPLTYLMTVCQLRDGGGVV